jgi:hypothetical protein
MNNRPDKLENKPSGVWRIDGTGYFKMNPSGKYFNKITKNKKKIAYAQSTVLNSRLLQEEMMNNRELIKVYEDTILLPGIYIIIDKITRDTLIQYILRKIREPKTEEEFETDEEFEIDEFEMDENIETDGRSMIVAGWYKLNPNSPESESCTLSPCY